MAHYFHPKPGPNAADSSVRFSVVVAGRRNAIAGQPQWQARGDTRARDNRSRKSASTAAASSVSAIVCAPRSSSSSSRAQLEREPVVSGAHANSSPVHPLRLAGCPKRAPRVRARARRGRSRVPNKLAIKAADIGAGGSPNERHLPACSPPALAPFELACSALRCFRCDRCGQLQAQLGPQNGFRAQSIAVQAAAWMAAY